MKCYKACQIIITQFTESVFYLPIHAIIFQALEFDHINFILEYHGCKKNFSRSNKKMCQCKNKSLFFNVYQLNIVLLSQSLALSTLGTSGMVKNITLYVQRVFKILLTVSLLKYFSLEDFVNYCHFYIFNQIGTYSLLSVSAHTIF